jgi:hypothetical protein
MSIQKYKFGHIINNKLVKTYVFSNGEAAPSEAVPSGIYLDDKIDTIKKKLLIQFFKKVKNY